MPTITRRFEFDAAHRVWGHEGKCQHLHGHRYLADVTVSSPELDSLGRVVDFSVLKEKIGKWIDENWDHNAIFNSNDPLAALPWGSRSRLGSRAPYILFDQNPTAEVLAEFLFGKADVLLDEPLKVVSVRIYETPNCSAEHPSK